MTETGGGERVGQSLIHPLPQADDDRSGQPAGRRGDYAFEVISDPTSQPFKRTAAREEGDAVRLSRALDATDARAFTGLR